MNIKAKKKFSLYASMHEITNEIYKEKKVGEANSPLFHATTNQRALEEKQVNDIKR